MSWLSRQSGPQPTLHRRALQPQSNATGLRAGLDGWKRTALALAVVGGLGAGLGGCGIRPLYGPTPSGQSLQQVMSSVQIAPIPGRVGQAVRNELIFASTGGGQAAPAKYRLEISLRESSDKVLVQQSGNATSETYDLQAHFKLVNIADGKVLFEGDAISQAPYDRFSNTFANVRAAYNAENRAANTVAQSIKTRIAAYLATHA